MAAGMETMARMGEGGARGLVGALGSIDAVAAGLGPPGEALGGPTEVQATVISSSEAKTSGRITRL